jgi:hypothetical protein
LTQLLVGLAIHLFLIEEAKAAEQTALAQLPAKENVCHRIEMGRNG